MIFGYAINAEIIFRFNDTYNENLYELAFNSNTLCLCSNRI